MNDAVEILDRETPFTGYFPVDRFRLRFRKFDGEWSEPMSREVFRVGPATVVLLYDPQRDEVGLIEQFRIAPYLNHRPAWLIECVAGLQDDGETPEATARREALEEANTSIGRLEKIGEYYSSPGAFDELITLFIGEIDADTTGGVFGLADEHENIKTHILPVADAIELMDDGKIVNVHVIVALQWLVRHGAALRERWLKE